MIEWFAEAPLYVLAPLLLAGTLGAGFVGHLLRLRADRHGRRTESETQEGYIVSGVLGLLAILLGFTLAMALDRFDTRRVLVVREANAITTAYLRAQMLGAPHRERLSKLLATYAENRLALGTATGDEAKARLERSDRLLTELWAATSAAFDSISNLDFSSSLVDAMNNVVNADEARKASRLARVPTAVFAVLLIYIVVTAGVMGFVLFGARGQLAGSFLIVLLSLSLLLIIDLDRPLSGAIRESQAPIERVVKALKAQPPEVFDRWRSATH